MAVQIARLVAVLALLIVAAALATPKGRLPLALRGVAKILHKDGLAAVPSVPSRTGVGKRILAFVLVLLAVLLAVVPVAKPVLPVLSRADRQEDSRPQLPLRAAAVR